MHLIRFLRMRGMTSPRVSLKRTPMTDPVGVAPSRLRNHRCDCTFFRFRLLFNTRVRCMLGTRFVPQQYWDVKKTKTAILRPFGLFRQSLASSSSSQILLTSGLERRRSEFLRPSPTSKMSMPLVLLDNRYKMMRNLF